MQLTSSDDDVSQCDAEVNKLASPCLPIRLIISGFVPELRQERMSKAEHTASSALSSQQYRSETLDAEKQWTDCSDGMVILRLLLSWKSATAG